jgi:hypothetical protein
MVRRIAIVLTVCFVLSGCGLLANTCVSRPPQDEAGARKWWEEAVASGDIASLRCWYQASEIHRQRGSSATYFRHQYCGQTMAGPCYSDVYFPTPIPADLLPRVQARLAKGQSRADSRADWAIAIANTITVVDCKNCTKHEAWDAWQSHDK